MYRPSLSHGGVNICGMGKLLNPKRLLGHIGDVNSIAAGRDIFATASNRHQGVESIIRIWSFCCGEPAGEIGTDLNSIFGLAISPDTRFLAAGGGGVFSAKRWEYTGGVEVWSLEEKKRVSRFGEKDLFFVKSIAFSPDGGTLLVSSLRKPSEKPSDNHRRVGLWRTSDFERTVSFGEHESGVEAACFSPNGQYVVFAENPASGEILSSASLLPTMSGQGLISALLKNKRTVELHDLNSMTPLIHIWNTANNCEEPVLELPKGRVERLAFSPDGRTLASCGSNLMTWDFEGRKAITEFAQRPQGYSRCLAFSPDGRILASGSGHRSGPGSPFQECGVKLWNSASGRLIGFLQHENPVRSLAFSGDGQRIVAGGNRGELLMWNTETFFSNS